MRMKVTMEDKELGKAVKRERLKRKISQANMADLLNCSQSQVSYYESGTHKLSLVQVNTIANEFKISINSLLASVAKKPLTKK